MVGRLGVEEGRDEANILSVKLLLALFALMLAARPVVAQDLSAGKTPAQLFSSDCPGSASGSQRHATAGAAIGGHSRARGVSGSRFWWLMQDGPYVQGVRVMMDAMTRADLYTKESPKYFNLAKNASSPILRDYYRRIAERYLTSDDELRPPEK